MKNHISETDFLYEWFGDFGRDLGCPTQFFTNNPQDLFDLIEKTAREKLPCYCSVQPRVKHHQLYGLEKLFFDFDYGKKSDRLTPKKIEKLFPKLQKEVKFFVDRLKSNGLLPLICKTRKGYHVYVFFESIFQVNQENIGLWRDLYKRLQLSLIPRDFKFLDRNLIGNVFALSRVPFSIHEQSGEKIILVDENLEPTKIRGLDKYRLEGIKADTLKKEKSFLNKLIEEQINKEIEKREIKRTEWEIKHGFVGKIRPCFTERLKSGEMSHIQRLALLVEAFYSGYNTEEKLIDLYRQLHDFNYDITAYQVRWFLKHRNGCRPWKCSTLMEKGLCLKEACSIYRERKQNEKKE